MLLLTILYIALLNIVYLIGFFSLSILLKVTETHYFLGYGSKPIKFQIRNVTFNIGFYIPIVGLSPIYTLVDGKKRMKYPWEFYQFNLVRRFIATFGGAITLLIAGVLIFIARIYFSTESIVTKEEVNKHGIYPSQQALEAGFLPGDKIIAVNGKDYQEFSDLFRPKVIIAPEVIYTVLRNGEKIQISIRDIAQKLMARGNPFISLRAPFEISEVIPGSPVDHAGIEQGDRITKVNNQPIVAFAEIVNAFEVDEDGQVTLLVERKMNDSLKTFALEVSLDEGRRVGMRPKELIHYTIKSNSFGEALQRGPIIAFATLSTNISILEKLTIGRLSSKETLSGPIGVPKISKESFWWFAGSYAMWYSFWNLLPLPKSAFWEVIPLAYEGLTKKKYPYAAFRKTLILSWVFFGGFYIWMVVNDIIKLFY